MSGPKSLIPILQLLTILYHMSRHTTVTTNNSSRAWPSSVITWTTISILLLHDSPIFRPTRALLIWADGRAGEEISIRSILLKVSWKDDISRLDKT